jgi:hypothetical protein
VDPYFVNQRYQVTQVCKIEIKLILPLASILIGVYRTRKQLCGNMYAQKHYVHAKYVQKRKMKRYRPGIGYDRCSKLSQNNDKKLHGA